MLNWLDRRTGFVTMTKNFLTEDIPGGASYWYVFGSATLFAMIVQIVTGIFLTFFYAPSAMTAWESTKYIYDHPFQHFVLSVHYWGASAMIALVFLHLLQTVIWGAYKSPRELQWVVGVLLLLVTMVLGLTGYLLPWDMDAYFASQVAINLTINVPIIGTFIQQFTQDGTTMGTLTINRFFGLHVWLMPAVLVALVGAHLAIFRHNGPAGPPVEDPRPLKKGRFWPDQMFMDAVASFIIFLFIVALAIFVPPFLDAKADPTVQFTPYPAWYFLDLFGLLNLVPGAFEIVGAIIIPGIATAILVLLPWIDRSTQRSTGSRKFILGLTAVSLAIIWGLTIWSQLSIMQKQATASPGAPPAATTKSAGGGTQIPPAQTATVSSSAKAGQAVFQTNCSSCHAAAGTGMPGVAPPLAANSFVTGDPNAVITTVLNGKTGAIQVNGQSYNGMMPPWKATLSNKQIADVVTYIRSALGSNSASGVTEAQVGSSRSELEPCRRAVSGVQLPRETTMIAAVPAIVQRASKAFTTEMRGYVGMQRHFTTGIKGGPIVHSEQSDSGVLLYNGYFVAAQYYGIVRDGKAYNAKQLADRTKQTSTDWLAGEVFFKEPYNPLYLRDYSFAERTPCAACRSGSAIVAFNSSGADAQHGRGTMWIDRATGHVLRLVYTPNALPSHATSGTVTETGGAALPRLWYVVRIDETYHGHVLFVSGNGTFIGIFDHFRRFSTPAAARAALSSKTI